jgi:excisionase family DNA binding protein
MDPKTTDAADRGWLTVPEAAEELRIPRTRCYELIAQGELPAVRIGERSIRVHREELERLPAGNAAHSRSMTRRRAAAPVALTTQ